MSKLYNILNSIITRLKSAEAQLEVITDDDFLIWLNETEVVEPVTDASGAIYTTNNNEIYIL